MEKTKLINWEEVRKEMFTEEELRKIDQRADKRIAIRKLKELRGINLCESEVGWLYLISFVCLRLILR